MKGFQIGSRVQVFARASSEGLVEVPLHDIAADAKGSFCMSFQPMPGALFRPLAHVCGIFSARVDGSRLLVSVCMRFVIFCSE